MRELWWLIRGNVRVRITGADPERTLRKLAQQIRLEEIRRLSHLVVEFTAAQSELNLVARTAERYGDRLEILGYRGLPHLLGCWLRYPVICGALIALVAVSLLLSGRVLFFRVEGNRSIPERQILEEAAACGLHFGASRADVRSEQVKNRLLDALPELSWVGVNTSGSVATVTVQERQRAPGEEHHPPGNIVADVDGIVTTVTATAGTPLCKVGDGVYKGQTLISGYTDLGLCIHVEAARGEVYALTERQITALLPRETSVLDQEQGIVKKYSLQLGKNRINFYSDSGILHTGCGKMTQIRVLTLPGGWTLPVALIVETYSLRERTSTERSPEVSRAILEQTAREALERSMIAGQIRSTETVFSEDDPYRLTLQCRCHEMIGRRSSGIMTEGDTNDGENDERGAG